MKRNMLLGGLVLTVGYVGQLAVTAFTYSSAPLPLLQHAGWLFLYLSALFGWWPIFALRKWGGVVSGKSYVQTTQVVDRGPYALVRHPQYTSGLLLAVGLICLSQHWLAVALGVIAAWATIHGMSSEEENCVEKFGAAYLDYAGKVPRMNLFAGTVRWLRRRKTRSETKGPHISG